MMSKNRLTHLDSLRGLAALSVVFSHYFLAYGFPDSWQNILTNSFLHIFWDGFAAVSLFFVLSGYVLSKKFFPHSMPHPIYFGIARISRIWIPFATIFIASFLIWKCLPQNSSNMESAWFRAFWQPENMLNARWLQQLFLWQSGPGESHLIPQDWTLSQELLLSLLLPIFLLISRFSSIILFVSTLASIIILKAPLLTLHFSLGVILAKEEMKLEQFLKTRNKLKLRITFIIGLIFYSFRFSIYPFMSQWIPEQRVWYITGIGSMFLLFFTLKNETAKKWLQKPLIVYLGQISFSIYLVHFTLLIAFVPKFILLMQKLGIIEINLLRLFSLLFYLSATIVISHFFHTYVDNPAIRLARRIQQMSSDIARLPMSKTP